MVRRLGVQGMAADRIAGVKRHGRRRRGPVAQAAAEWNGMAAEVGWAGPARHHAELYRGLQAGAAGTA
jgi:hypothetical protein